MEKTNYYISVQAQTVLEDKGAAAYEFEILANINEVDQLQQLFEEYQTAETSTSFRAGIPGLGYHLDQENDNYDYWLQQIYQFIHDHGTPETKQHIEDMNIQVFSKEL